MEIIDMYEEDGGITMKVKSPHLSEDQSVIYLDSTNLTTQGILKAWTFQQELIQKFGKEKLEYLQNNCPTIETL